MHTGVGSYGRRKSSYQLCIEEALQHGLNAAVHNCAQAGATEATVVMEVH